MRLALIGVPNSGKSTVFNALTGKKQRTANYPGVTMSLVEGDVHDSDWTAIDLPGVYTLYGEAPEQQVVYQYMTELAPQDRVAVVADATQLAGQLPLFYELQELGVSPLLLLTMSDVVSKDHLTLDLSGIAQKLDTAVLYASGLQEYQIQELIAFLNEKSSNLGAREPLALVDSAVRSLQETDQTKIAAAIENRYAQAKAITDEFVSVPAARDGEELQTFTHRIDAWVLHPLWGSLIILGVLFLAFQIIFRLADIPNALIIAGFDALAGYLTDVAGPTDNLIIRAVQEAVIPGIGTVISFLPNILLFSFFILMLDASGYVARMSLVFDKILTKTKLSGYSVFPLLSGLSCALLAVSATRSIPDRKARLLAISVIPLIPCTARLPAYSLLIAAFIPSMQLGLGIELRGIVLLVIYLVGIFSAVAVAAFLSRYTQLSSSTSFILELPNYRLPKLRDTLVRLWQRTSIYLYRAGTIILLGTLLIWMMTAINVSEGSGLEASLAGWVGAPLHWLFAPLGFDLEMSIAMVPGMLAREVLVSSLATMYGTDVTVESEMVSIMATQWSLAVALSFLTWTIYAPQCMSTFAIIKAETGSNTVTLRIFFGLLALAYALSFIVYRVGSLMLE